MTPHDPTPEALIAELLRDLAELPTLGLPDGFARQRRAEAFMRRLFDLGRAASDSWRASPAGARLAMAGEAALDAIYVDLQLVLAGISGMLWGGWSEGDWEKLCVRRSGLAFFEEFFREALESHEYGPFDALELDERIRARSDDEGYLDFAAVPTGVPATHWWWWAPREPPADAGRPQP
jgi:hypothetical protein